jgi:hypothetical protein
MRRKHRGGTMKRQRIDPSRRRFLGWSGPGMVWLSMAGLSACGGGGDDDPGGSTGGGGGTGTGGTGGGTGGGGSGGGATTAAQRAATLESVRTALARLSAGSDGFDSNALATELQGLPGIAAVGISTRVGNVWARFADGRWLVVPNNLRGVAPSGLGRAQPLALRERAAGLAGEFDTPAILTGRQYRQLDMLGRVPFGSSPEAAHLCFDSVDADTLPKLRRMAVGRGFALPAIQTAEPPDFGIDNGVRGLAEVSGDGVFFVTAPAAQAGADDTAYTMICTDTPATEANLAAFESDLAAGVLAYAVRLRGVDGAWQPYPCLAISPAFVADRRWRFPTECIGIFNLSGAPSLSDWIPALYGAGLRHILGWRQAVSWQRLLAFADDLIQLNLATNNLDGRLVSQNPEPRLRAYGMGETLFHLERRGLTGGRDGSFYLQDPMPALYVNTLLPTIDYATLREERLEFELTGQFGAPALVDNAQPRIVVARAQGPAFAEPLLWRAADPPLGGIDTLRDPQWQGGLLQTVLDLAQLDRGGYVQVFNGGRCSNVVPITHWEIPIQATVTIDELTLAVEISVRLRADVHGWRLGPEGFARNGESQMALSGSVHSRASFVASGSISRYDAGTLTRTTIDWLGSGSLGNAIGDFRINFSGELAWDTRELSLVSLAVAGGASHQQRTVTEQFDVNGVLLRRSEQMGDVPVTLAAAGPGATGSLLSMGFDSDWNLRSGAFEMPPVDSAILPAPPQRLRRTRIAWPQVRPDFAPRNDYGGT